MGTNLNWYSNWQPSVSKQEILNIIYEMIKNKLNDRISLKAKWFEMKFSLLVLGIRLLLLLVVIIINKQPPPDGRWGAVMCIEQAT